MNTLRHPNISLKSMLKGTRAFDKTVHLQTAQRMFRALVRTALNSSSHAQLNWDQRDILQGTLKNPWKSIAVLVPGFQLDGTSLIGVKRAFNARGIPALFPEDLPHGRKAVLYRWHPNELVDSIVRYVLRIIEKHPQENILLVGHSYGGAQVYHATDRLTKEGVSNVQIIPISISGTMAPVGESANAIHALYFQKPSDVFSWRDPFIQGAQEIQDRGDWITFVDPHDKYLPISVQAGAMTDPEHPHRITSDKKRSPGHYHQGSDRQFSEYVVESVIKRLGELQITQH